MIKLIRCIRRRENVSKESFHHYWTSEQRLRHVQKLLEQANVCQVKVNLTLDITFNDQLREERHCDEEPYDAIIEIWWSDYNTMINALHGEKFVVLRSQLEKMDGQYVDNNCSPMFFTDEQSLI